MQLESHKVAEMGMSEAVRIINCLNEAVHYGLFHYVCKGMHNSEVQSKEVFLFNEQGRLNSGKLFDFSCSHDNSFTGDRNLLHLKDELSFSAKNPLLASWEVILSEIRLI